MRYSTLIAAIAAGASLVNAAPIEERGADAVDYTVPRGDVTILNYTLTLEYLERKFYMEGLAQFKQEDFANASFPDPFYANLQEVYWDEMVALPLLFLGFSLSSRPILPLLHMLSPQLGPRRFRGNL